MALFTPYVMWRVKYCRRKINQLVRLGDLVLVLYFCSEAPNATLTTAIANKKLWSLKYGSILSSLVTSMVPKTKGHPDAQLVAISA
jgi:hypothetical protein